MQKYPLSGIMLHCACLSDNHAAYKVFYKAGIFSPTPTWISLHNNPLYHGTEEGLTPNWTAVESFWQKNLQQQRLLLLQFGKSIWFLCAESSFPGSEIQWLAIFRCQTCYIFSKVGISLGRHSKYLNSFENIGIKVETMFLE